MAFLLLASFGVPCCLPLHRSTKHRARRISKHFYERAAQEHVRATTSSPFRPAGTAPRVVASHEVRLLSGRLAMAALSAPLSDSTLNGGFRPVTGKERRVRRSLGEAQGPRGRVMGPMPWPGRVHRGAKMEDGRSAGW